MRLLRRASSQRRNLLINERKDVITKKLAPASWGKKAKQSYNTFAKPITATMKYGGCVSDYRKELTSLRGGGTTTKQSNNTLAITY